MAYFEAKMHRIRFRLGLFWGVNSAPPDSLAGFQGLASKEKGEGGDKRGNGSEQSERELTEGEYWAYF